MTREELSEQYFVNNQALHRAWRVLFMSRMQDLKGLSPPQLWLLKSIKEHQPISGKELAGRLQVSRSAITQMLDGLGLFIERQPDAKDRRIIRISLSDEGNARLRDFDKIMKEFIFEEISALDDAELTVMVSAQSKMLARLESHLAP